MRVALLTRAAHPLHPPGGMERAVFSQARALQGRGVETLLVTRPPTCAGVFPGEVLTVPWTGRADEGHGRVLDRVRHYPRFSVAVGEAVAGRVRAGTVDVVDAQGLTALGYGRLRAADRTLRAPLVMNPQGMEEHKTTGLKRLLLRPLRRASQEAARRADRVVATDEATRDEVPALLGVPPEKVVVLPNGIDPEDFPRLTAEEARAAAHSLVPALAEASPVFLSVGRLEGYKGFADVQAALLRLAAASRLPARWAWVVVGEGPLRPALTRGAAALGGRVHLVGRVDEPRLHALYARADLFVHATRYEGSSLVTLEAMAHGLPVLATRAGGIPDKVVDGDTGTLVPPGDVEALAEGLAALAADPARRLRLGQAGRQRALAEFTWPVLVGRTIALYQELLGEARG